MKFYIISPGYKCEDYISMHIGSVLGQRTDVPYHHIMMNDGNSEEMRNIASQYLSSNRHILWTNNQKGVMNSHIECIKQAKILGMEKEDIIVHLDADDWFFHPFVLKYLYRIYSETDCWATYGNYVATDGVKSIARPVNQKFDRKIGEWWFTHLRTFKAGLWDHIRKDSFIDDNNNMFRMAADVAICAPILELCPLDKIQFIPYVNVVYNRISDINEDKLDRSEIVRTFKSISSKKAYQELKSL